MNLPVGRIRQNDFSNLLMQFINGHGWRSQLPSFLHEAGLPQDASDEHGQEQQQNPLHEKGNQPNPFYLSSPFSQPYVVTLTPGFECATKR